jgi:hypothetical protein
MDKIRALILLARRQLRLAHTAEAVATGLVAAAILAALLTGYAKLSPYAILTSTMFASAITGAFAVSVIVVLVLRAREAPTEATLALRIDERLHLSERLTTALALERSTDAYARCAVSDAVESASKPDAAKRVKAAFPVRIPDRAYWATSALAASIGLQIFAPVYAWPIAEDIEAEPVKLAQKKASTDAIERVKQELESSKALPTEIKSALAKVAANADEKTGDEPTEDARREAIKRMGDLQKKLDALHDRPDARTNDALKQDLSSLEKQDGEVAKFAEALSKGDFAAAKQELGELTKKLESGEMTEAEKNAAKDALEKMAKSLEALAEKQESLKKALEEAGLDSQLANNAEALERAIAENNNLNEQQRAELKKAAAGAKASQKALKQMAKSAKSAAKPGQQQQQQKPGQQQQQQKPGQQQQQQKPGQQQQQQKPGEGGDSPNPGQNPGEGKSGESGQPQEGQQSEGNESGGEGLAELAESLSELEITEQMLAEAEALSNMSESESQSLGEGMCKGGNCNKPGDNPGSKMGEGTQRGMAGGRAQGGNTGKSKTPTGVKSQKAKSNTVGGDIIARQLIENPNPEIGESMIPSESISEAVDGGAGVAVSEEQVPSHLKEAHQHYFGTLKRELAKRASDATAAPAAAPADSSGAAVKPSGAAVGK